MEEDRILFTKEDGIGIITLNRPDEMNMLNDDMFLDLTNIQNECTLDDEVKAVIFTGNGRAFTAGLEVTRLPNDHDKIVAERKRNVKKV